MVVLCGGTRNIRKSNLTLELYSLTYFMKRSNNTNVIATCPRHQYDISSASCVNKEVIKFNRKLRKIVQSFSHVQVLSMSSNRYHFTRHSLHLNTLGKDCFTEKLA